MREGSKVQSSTLRLTFQAEDAREALPVRNAVTAFLRAYGDERSDIEGAILILGELIANVIRHAPGSVCVEIEWPAEDLQPTMHVEDDGPGLGRIPVKATDVWDESGRGFAIVDELSDKLWAQPRREDHARLSAVLPVYRRRLR